MMKKLTIVVLLVMFIMSGCTSNNNNNQEQQVIQYSEEEVVDVMNTYYSEFYPYGTNGSMNRVLDDGTVFEITFSYYYDLDFEELACRAVVDLYTGNVVETGSDGTVIAEYNIEDISDIEEYTSSSDEDAELVNSTSLEKLEGRVVVRPNFQGIVGDDGYVYTKGDNTYGELGNGERVSSYEWCRVEGIENVVGIYASTYFGDESVFAEFQHCYALTGNGDVYRWGANILSPQKVELFSKVKTITQSTNTMFIFRCENNETYIMKTADWGGGEDKIMSYHSLGESAKIAYIKDDSDADTYAIMQNSEVIYIRNNHLSDFSQHNILHVDEESFEEGIMEQHTIDVNEPISDMFGKYLVTDTGSIIRVDYEGGTVKNIPIADLGGSGYKKFYYSHNLFEGGQLQCKGDNEYGQLGDGTNLDYDDDFLTIDEAAFTDIYVGDNAEYIVALDFNNNIWCWGREFGSTPEITIHESEFLGGF